MEMETKTQAYWAEEREGVLVLHVENLETKTQA
jgi:hypothetical protein